jgi:hypothetical protein
MHCGQGLRRDPALQCIMDKASAPSRAAAPATHVLPAILRPERPINSGTARTVNVPVKAPWLADVIERPNAWAVYPAAMHARNSRHKFGSAK